MDKCFARETFTRSGCNKPHLPRLDPGRTQPPGGPGTGVHRNPPGLGLWFGHNYMAMGNPQPVGTRLAAACERADIVVSERWLPRSCRPRWLKADRDYLEASGGLAIVLDGPRLRSVGAEQGDHPWWAGGQRN